jgi:PUA domain protein
MSDLRLKNRHPVSDDDVAEANDAVEAAIGVRPLPEDTDQIVEQAKADPYELFLVDGSAFAVVSGPEIDQPTPTLRALLQTRPGQHEVTVDMGAVPHLRNGADVMSPGITEADDSIEEGDLVFVTDVEHGQPLGIGHALVDGDEMIAESGKAIAIWHHVGDELWQVGA